MLASQFSFKAKIRMYVNMQLFTSASLKPSVKLIEISGLNLFIRISIAV